MEHKKETRGGQRGTDWNGGVGWIHAVKDTERGMEGRLLFSNYVAFLCVSNRYQANSTCWSPPPKKKPLLIFFAPFSSRLEAVIGHCSEQMEIKVLTNVTFCACHYHDNSPQPPASVPMKVKRPLPPALPWSDHCSMFLWPLLDVFMVARHALDSSVQPSCHLKKKKH